MFGAWKCTGIPYITSHFIAALLPCAWCAVFKEKVKVIRKRTGSCLPPFLPKLATVHMQFHEDLNHTFLSVSGEEVKWGFRWLVAQSRPALFLTPCVPHCQTLTRRHHGVCTNLAFLWKFFGFCICFLRVLSASQLCSSQLLLTTQLVKSAWVLSVFLSLPSECWADVLTLMDLFTWNSCPKHFHAIFPQTWCEEGVESEVVKAEKSVWSCPVGYRDSPWTRPCKQVVPSHNSEL